MKQRKSITVLMIITIAVILSVYLLIYFGKTQLSLRKDMNVHSDMSFLSAGISEGLQEYYEKNENYPANLQALRESILNKAYTNKIPDGPNVMDYFDRFKYSTDGDNYNITWEAKHGDTIYTHKEEGQKGELVKTELYINGELLKRDQ